MAARTIVKAKAYAAALACGCLLAFPAWAGGPSIAARAGPAGTPSGPQSGAGQRRSCAALKELPATPIAVGKDRYFQVNGKSACLQVQAGVAEPVLLLRLPRIAGTYYVTVRTRHWRKVLLPKLKLLSADRQSLRTITVQDMRRRGGVWSATFFVRPGGNGPAFLLAYADPALVGSGRKKLQQASTVVYPGIPLGTEKKVTVTYTETGSLEVQAVPYGHPAIAPAGG